MTEKIIGHKIWAIAEGYIPEWSNGPLPEMESHETLCFLNTSNRAAHVVLTIYFADHDPVGPYQLTVFSKRTLHQRFNELEKPQFIPKGTNYACLVISAFVWQLPALVQFIY